VSRKDNKEEGAISVKVWRYYQNFLQLFNYCNAPVVFPILCVTWAIVIVTGSYSTLKLFGTVHISMYVLLLVSTFDGLVAINNIYKAAGECFENSKNLIHRLVE